jgi:hypothetical protein
MEYNDVLNDEKMSAVKAQRGIETMEILYSQLQENEEQDDEGEEGEQNKGNGDENGQ